MILKVTWGHRKWRDSRGVLYHFPLVVYSNVTMMAIVGFEKSDLLLQTWVLYEFVNRLYLANLLSRTWRLEVVFVLMCCSVQGTVSYHSLESIPADPGGPGHIQMSSKTVVCVCLYSRLLYSSGSQVVHHNTQNKIKFHSRVSTEQSRYHVEITRWLATGSHCGRKTTLWSRGRSAEFEVVPAKYFMGEEKFSK